MASWGTPDHDHSQYAERSDLDYEADQLRDLKDDVGRLDDRMTELRDWLHDDARQMWEHVRDLQGRIEKLEETLEQAGATS